MRKIVDSGANLLDALTGLFPDSSRTTLRQMLQAGRVRVNGRTEKNARRDLAPGEIVEVGEKAQLRTLPEGLSILHEDVDIIVVLKANGLLTVATERDRENTAQAYLNAYLGMTTRERIHVVHRLDRETSGVLVFAKNFHSREMLKEQFAAHTVDRVYVAMIEGLIEPEDGTFRSHLRERKDLKMVSVDPIADSKLAITHYRTVRTNGRYSMLEVQLETGRKNQIRAHLSEAGHPVLGDKMYGSEVNPLSRLGLHARLLGFDHPTTGKHMVFEAAVPGSFEGLVR